MSASPASTVAQVGCVRGIPVVTVAGRLDTTTAPMFDAETASLHSQPCSRSVGLRSIFKLKKHTASRGGRAGAFSVSEHNVELLEISGFRPLLDIYPDLEFALKEGMA